MMVAVPALQHSPMFPRTVLATFTAHGSPQKYVASDIDVSCIRKFASMQFVMTFYTKD